MIDPEQFRQLVDAFTRIADVLEGTTDDSGLIHIYVRPEPAEEEARRMRRELADVTQERDILKKALAIFSKEPK